MSQGSVLRLTAVSRRFGRGATAVRAVRSATLNVYGGEVVAIMGPSGSGKSTLLSLMGGLLTPDSGEVLIAGQALHKLPAESLARLRRTQIGFIFQNFNLLKALTAIENVEVGLRLAGIPGAQARNRAKAALAVVGLAARAHALPRDLSGGEQQRAAVARALTAAPALVLADEPTGSLDAANGRAVIDMICAHVHRSGATAVIVTHDRRVSAVVDRMLWMEDGLLKASEDVEAVELRACGV